MKVSVSDYKFKTDSFHVMRLSMAHIINRYSKKNILATALLGW